MIRTIYKILAISYLLICLQLVARCQTEFGNANSLLQQLAADQKNLAEERDVDKAKLQYDRVAEEVKSIPSDVERLLNRAVVSALNTSPASSAAELQLKLRSALQIEATATEKNSNAFVFSFGPEQKPSYIVTYTISYCAVCGRSWLGVVGPKEEHYQIVASLENPFPNQSINIVSLGTETAGGPLFLIFGTLWGDAHRRLNASVYSVDGQQLKSVWSLSQLPEGELDVSGGTIIVRSYTTLQPPFFWRTEMYALTREGIKLQSASVHPVD